MYNNNNEIFRRIWERVKPYGLSLISSNGGTGKTTYFTFAALRAALDKHEHVHFFVRYANEMEAYAERILVTQPTFSKRKIKLLQRLKVEKDGDKFIYLTEVATGRRIAQIVNVFGQAYYKKFGNTIGATRAIFDEILSENGEYCPDEVNKFSRLVFTMARSNDYHVIGLYNNTNPNFPYFEYYGGKSYNTHISNSNALFVYFTAAQYAAAKRNTDPRSIQSIIQKTDYNAVYNNNSFVQYKALYLPMNLHGAPKLFRVLIESRIFWLRQKNGYMFIEAAHRKPTKKPTFTINLPEVSTLPQLPEYIRAAVRAYASTARLKAIDLNDTIFVKILEKRC